MQHSRNPFQQLSTQCRKQNYKGWNTRYNKNLEQTRTIASPFYLYTCFNFFFFFFFPFLIPQPFCETSAFERAMNNYRGSWKNRLFSKLTFKKGGRTIGELRYLSSILLFRNCNSAIMHAFLTCSSTETSILFESCSDIPSR